MPDSINKTLLQFLEEIVDVVLLDVQSVYVAEPNHEKYKEQYLDTIRASLKRYDHHQGNRISDESIIQRFLRETAILHVATEIFISMSESTGETSYFWPVNDPSSSYSWYEITNSVQEQIDSIAKLILQHHNAAILVIDLCDQLLTSKEERYIGEFYTPPSIVRHLIDTAKFHPSDLISGSKVVDPACGGGMILTSIALRFIEHALSKNIESDEIIHILNENLFGFDIQPFAIILCRSSLIYVTLPLIKNPSNASTLFCNVKLLDPLAYGNEFWSQKMFSYVIANPPFMSVKRASLDFVDDYDDVIYGHPNLYILFLWWAIKSTTTDAIISVLLPQSMLIGSYFSRLREKIAETTTLLDVTRMIDRKGVVGSADQQMMTICLKVGTTKSKRHKVALRVTRNGDDIERAKPIQVKPDQVVKNINGVNFWVISESKLDYEIEEALVEKSPVLGDLEDMFQLGNGGYVWNQNKDLIVQEKEPDTIPLISSASISVYEFEFPYTGTHRTHERPYSKVTDKVKSNIREGHMILNQRTTPTKVGRRLVCTIPNDDFFLQHPQFFLENHVNYIASTKKSLDDLFGLLAWLNSDVVNFVFQLRNGATQVSIFELKLLPVHLASLTRISELGKQASCADFNKRNDILVSVNEDIIKGLNLSAKHKKRIEEVLKRKEKHK